jgi:hypothetical protein
MADTSPHDTHHRRGRHGTPGQTADRPPMPSAALLLETDVAERRCWRCLHTVPRDSPRARTPRPQWWRCDSCDRILRPAEQLAA